MKKRNNVMPLSYFYIYAIVLSLGYNVQLTAADPSSAHTDSDHTAAAETLLQFSAQGVRRIVGNAAYASSGATTAASACAAAIAIAAANATAQGGSSPAYGGYYGDLTVEAGSGGKVVSQPQARKNYGCPFRRCKYICASMELLSDHFIATHHKTGKSYFCDNNLAVVKVAPGKFLCTFPECGRIMRAPFTIKDHYITQHIKRGAWKEIVFHVRCQAASKDCDVPGCLNTSVSESAKMIHSLAKHWECLICNFVGTFPHMKQHSCSGSTN